MYSWCNITVCTVVYSCVQLCTVVYSWRSVVNAPFFNLSPNGPGQLLWEKEFVSGEENMSHYIGNLEHHHFKYLLRNTTFPDSIACLLARPIATPRA